MLECADFTLLTPLVRADFASWHLLDCDLPPVLLVDAFKDVAEATVTYHFAKLPFCNRQRLFLLFECQRVLLDVVLDLIRTEVAIFVVALEVVLKLLEVRLRDLRLVKRTDRLVHQQVSLPLYLLLCLQDLLALLELILHLV